MPNLASNFRSRCETVISRAGRKARGAARRCSTRQMLKSSCWSTLSHLGKGYSFCLQPPAQMSGGGVWLSLFQGQIQQIALTYRLHKHLQ